MQGCLMSFRNWSKTVHLVLARTRYCLKKGKLPWKQLKIQLWGHVLDVSACPICVLEIVSGFWGAAAPATSIPNAISELTLPVKVSLDNDTECKQDLLNVNSNPLKLPLWQRWHFWRANETIRWRYKPLQRNSWELIYQTPKLFLSV